MYWRNISSQKWDVRILNPVVVLKNIEKYYNSNIEKERKNVYKN